MKRPAFTHHPVGGDRRFYVLEEDVLRVFERLPRPVRQAVRRLRLDDEGWATYRLGHAAPGGREVALCALPPRLSLTRFLSPGQGPGAFGAVRGSQWPPLAVRRYQLYHAFLRECLRAAEGELGLEARANALRDELWSEGADDAAPAHGPPSEAETLRTRECWEPAHKSYKLGLARERENDAAGAQAHYTACIAREQTHPGARLSLALEALEGRDWDAALESVDLALSVGPCLPGAHLARARALLGRGDSAGAWLAFESGAHVEPRPAIAWALHGAALEAAGDRAAGERLLRRALRKDPNEPVVLRTVAAVLERRDEGDAQVRAAELRARLAARTR